MGFPFMTKKGATTVRALENEISKLKAIKEQRAAELAKTMSALATDQERILKLLQAQSENIDYPALKKVQQDQLAHERHGDDLRLAIEAFDKQIDQKQTELDATVTRELAEKLASDAESDLGRYRKSMDCFLRACGELAVAGAKVGEHSFAAREVVELAGIFKREFPHSLAHTEQEVRDRVRALRAGVVKAKPRVAAPITPEPTPAAPKETIKPEPVLADAAAEGAAFHVTIGPTMHGVLN